jgi:hypothetical protein
MIIADVIAAGLDEAVLTFDAIPGPRLAAVCGLAFRATFVRRAHLARILDVVPITNHAVDRVTEIGAQGRHQRANGYRACQTDHRR